MPFTALKAEKSRIQVLVWPVSGKSSLYMFRQQATHSMLEGGRDELYFLTWREGQITLILLPDKGQSLRSSLIAHCQKLCLMVPSTWALREVHPFSHHPGLRQPPLLRQSLAEPCSQEPTLQGGASHKSRAIGLLLTSKAQLGTTRPQTVPPSLGSWGLVSPPGVHRCI